MTNDVIIRKSGHEKGIEFIDENHMVLFDIPLKGQSRFYLNIYKRQSQDVRTSEKKAR